MLKNTQTHSLLPFPHTAFVSYRKPFAKCTRLTSPTKTFRRPWFSLNWNEIEARVAERVAEELAKEREKKWTEKVARKRKVKERKRNIFEMSARLLKVETMRWEKEEGEEEEEKKREEEMERELMNGKIRAAKMAEARAAVIVEGWEKPKVKAVVTAAIAAPLQA